MDLSNPVELGIVVIVGILFLFGIKKLFNWSDSEEDKGDVEEMEEKMKICYICKKDVNDDEGRVCSECDNYICEEHKVYFENIDEYICKKCIDKAYPRESKTETKIEYKEKIVEKPVYIDKEGKEITTLNSKKFD